MHRRRPGAYEANCDVKTWFLLRRFGIVKELTHNFRLCRPEAFRGECPITGDN